MLAEAIPRVQGRFGQVMIDRAATLLFGLLSLIYFFQATTLAAHAPFWMDEILTLWTARLPDLASIWAALAAGAEFTPPLYDWLIHALQQAGVSSALGLRFPSIVAMYIAALATGAIARRHVGTAPAALAAGIVLASGLFGYAVQVRPYALVTAAFACALALYDQRQPLSNRRLAAIALLMALAIGLHFYALLLVGAIALLELVRARGEARPVSRGLIAALAVASCSILAWLPILIAARAFSGADTGAPGYYGQPVPLALVRTYAMLLGWLTLPLAGLLAASTLVPGRATQLRATALVMSAVPLGIFAFALVVSHSYADRYALVGGIGVALLFASLAHQVGQRWRLVSPVILAALLLATPWRDGGEIGKVDRLEALATVEPIRDTLPIVTGSGLRFFELRENTRFGAQMVFLDLPAASLSDPTNRNQVMRWKAIDPRLRIQSAAEFVCARPVFYLFAQPGDGGADALPGWLAGHADFAPPPASRASITLVHARPCPSRPMERR